MPVITTSLFIGISLLPDHASAGFFDFLLGHAPSNVARPSTPHPNNNADSTSTALFDSGHSSGYCVRTCDGRYFPVQARGNASTIQMCEAFCPAAPTQVYFGNNIDNAVSTTGERYTDSRNAFAYRKALKADCTCNGRDPTGLAPVDLSFDTTLKSGDIIATSDGLVAYSLDRAGRDRVANFTPVTNHPGLTPAIRAQLNAVKVATDDGDRTEDAVRQPLH